jgi:hypothetical protein
LLVKFLFSLILFSGIAWFARKQHVSPVTTGLLMLVVAMNLGYFWSIRPQLFSFLYYFALLGLLNYSFAGWRGQWHLRRSTAAELASWENQGQRPIGYDSRRLKYLWFAPLLFCLWANTHGAFVAGICIYVAYLTFRGVEAAMRLGPASAGLLRRFALMIVVALLGTFVNPYGPRLHLWLWESLSVPRPEVMEWAQMHFWNDVGIRFLVAAVCALTAVALSRRPRDFAEWSILAITLFQAWSVHRHIPFFVIAAGLWLPVHLDSALLRLRNWWPIRAVSSASDAKASLWSRRAYQFACGLLVVALASKMTSIKVPKSEYPVDAFQFMADHGLNGRMVVSFNWAQYALAAFAVPRDSETTNSAAAIGRLSFDGRYDTCYPQTVIDFHFDFLSGDASDRGRCRGPQSPPFDPTAILRYGQPELAVLRRHQENSTHFMKTQSDSWCLLYRDAIAEVWGLRSKYDRPDSQCYLPVHQRRVSESQPQGVARWPALPQWPTTNTKSAVAHTTPSN